MRYINYSLQLKCKYRKKKKETKKKNRRRKEGRYRAGSACLTWLGLAWLACLGQVKHLQCRPTDPRALELRVSTSSSAVSLFGEWLSDCCRGCSS